MRHYISDKQAKLRELAEECEECEWVWKGVNAMAYTDNKNMEISDHLQKLLKDKNHQIILAVPIESCHLNRKRHLVVISAPADRQKPLKHER